MIALRSEIARARLGERPALVGPFLAVPSPMVTEIACAARPDFVCIDMEHGPIAPTMAEDMLRAAALWDVPALVRVPGPDAAAIGQALDFGAVGVLVPRVSSADEARAAVAAARFPPEGRRGLGPCRASGYGRNLPDYLDAARAQTVVAIQIETVDALDALDAILAVPGIDLAFVGPGDLGVGLAAAARAMSLEHAIDGVLDAAADRQCAGGIFTMTMPDLARYDGRVALAICGSDSTVLSNGFSGAFG
ncbi:MAG: 4-hydroxy-2-oxoheptanedioate aldolase [Rhodobacteraceae bacterium HLUCCA12]|nr:MAG: 4-hydroxy-2-oxoheptanedioate aldolase [Rhodobacteraceae bacterium HLUCCA12]